VLVEGAGPHLRVARALGGRPLAVLPLPDREAVETMLRGAGSTCTYPSHPSKNRNVPSRRIVSVR
jgi:hypothetical protein